MKTASISRSCLLVAALFTVLAGCRATHSVKGKVIEGNLSFVAVVSQGDERLKTQGIPNADVAARMDVGRVAGNLVSQIESDAKGDFTLKFKDQGVLMRALEFSASAEGFRAAVGVMNMPPTDQRLLIILARSGPPTSGSR